MPSIDPPPSPPAAPALAAVSPSWRQDLAAWLAAHRTYPAEARRRGETGSVVVTFTVERSGRVRGVAISRGSGSAILDAAAEAMLREAMLPPFPAAMPQDRMTVTVQVRFALQD